MLFYFCIHAEGRSTGVHNLSKRFYSDSSQIPTNMKMFDAAERSATITERYIYLIYISTYNKIYYSNKVLRFEHVSKYVIWYSTREVYESNRVDQSTTNGNIIISIASDTSDSNRYDVAGNAQMTPALQVLIWELLFIYFMIF